MTPSKIIYSGFRKKSPEPFLYHTKNAKGEIVTKEVHFADPMKNKFYQPEAEGRCNLCGETLKDGGIPVKKMLGSTYMDWAIHKAPEEKYLCTACAFCLGIFQSTLPRRERLVLLAVALTYTSFQSTLPRRERQ